MSSKVIPINVKFKSFKIILPPIKEQEEIHKVLSRKLNENSSMVRMENTRIEKFIEYHQSLIYSVVTGKVQITKDMI